MGYVVALIVGIACGALSMAMMVAREHRRAARFLEHRPAGSNARLNVQVPGQAWRELAKAINSTLDAIQSERIRSIGERQEFQRGMSALAHDVRTPLMGAQGHIQLALDDLASKSCATSSHEDAIQHNSAEWSGDKEVTVRGGDGSLAESGDVPQSSRHLTAALNRLADMRDLLDQLFSYARANDPDRELDIEPVTVYSLVAGVLVGHYPEFEERGWEPIVEFEDEDFKVEADKAALVRIVDNLVINMLRHGEGSPMITQRGRTVTFANTLDRGVVASLDPNRLFARFYQADDARSSGGSGLGLSVAQTLAQSMGMSLTARLERTDGNGAGGQPCLIIELRVH
ncbi:sensor histidine kinase [Bifidobacterium oedipodis]|uniref:histidine kinase n=1 Tax=Bifidobacterium oedipodis TaxID=2675322 RepID=A0A7Y0ENT8_9BIFI|nr:ATP-binding protein [Bifidobacterium sp. DSM 109957]NMM93655.1 histidine kinase [Bifidobacterium sp. DSM 109957]